MPEPFGSLVVRVRPIDAFAVTLGAVDDPAAPARASAIVEVRGTLAEVVAVTLATPADGTTTARLLDGIGDALRARGVERVRFAADVAL